MLSCRDIAHKASDYIDGTMTARQRAGFYMHVLICKYCQDFMGKLRLSREMCARMPEHDKADPETTDRILERLRQARESDTEKPEE